RALLRGVEGSRERQAQALWTVRPLRRWWFLPHHRHGGRRILRSQRPRGAAMNWLLIFVPVAIGLEHWAPQQHLAIFFVSGLAILPLAAWMGRATEHLAERMGEGMGGLLNATFGNAAELIIAVTALRSGLYNVVKASIAGSIVGNILLVLGA